MRQRPLLTKSGPRKMSSSDCGCPFVQLKRRSGQRARRVRTENCPPGMKTGDQISPRGGYVGGGLQMQTDLAISPAGDVWVMNNWQDIDSCYRNANEALSTRCGGQGVTVFFGMAKPVRAPQIGPSRGYDR